MRAKEELVSLSKCDHRGGRLRKLFNHLHGKHIRVRSQALSSIDYQRIATPSIPPRARRDAGRRYALVVCKSLSFPLLPRIDSDKGAY